MPSPTGTIERSNRSSVSRLMLRSLSASVALLVSPRSATRPYHRTCGEGARFVGAHATCSSGMGPKVYAAAKQRGCLRVRPSKSSQLLLPVSVREPCVPPHPRVLNLSVEARPQQQACTRDSSPKRSSSIRCLTKRREGRRTQGWHCAWRTLSNAITPPCRMSGKTASR